MKCDDGRVPRAPKSLARIRTILAPSTVACGLTRNILAVASILLPPGRAQNEPHRERVTNRLVRIEPRSLQPASLRTLPIRNHHNTCRILFADLRYKVFPAGHHGILRRRSPPAQIASEWLKAVLCRPL